MIIIGIAALTLAVATPALAQSGGSTLIVPLPGAPTSQARL
jgi:hypothetical protein